MNLVKEYHEALIKERLKILMGAMYDVRFYRVALKDSLNQDVEVLRDEMTDKKVELGSLMRARAVAERKKGALLPDQLKKLDELTDRVNELSGQGGIIDEIMEAQATIKALEKKEKNAKKYYNFVKTDGGDVLREVEVFIK